MYCSIVFNIKICELYWYIYKLIYLLFNISKFNVFLKKVVFLCFLFMVLYLFRVMNLIFFMLIFLVSRNSLIVVIIVFVVVFFRLINLRKCVVILLCEFLNLVMIYNWFLCVMLVFLFVRRENCFLFIFNKSFFLWNLEM